MASGADRGVATVWVAVTATVLCTVFALVLALGQAVAARHRAGGAADLAALAAADRALEGAVVACEAARRVALAQGGELARCAVDGEIADVTARARFGPYAPTVRARAGPAGPGSGAEAGPGAGTGAGTGLGTGFGTGPGVGEEPRGGDTDTPAGDARVFEGGDDADTRLGGG
ncbi:Rv3654c family TadE-like protein [Streptomyces sp. NPDC059694]|nr:Rv3654c family TadE-like protein [Streptomyces sp. CB02366]